MIESGTKDVSLSLVEKKFSIFSRLVDAVAQSRDSNLL